MRTRIFFLIAIFLVFAGPATAEVAIETSVSRSRVAVGEELTLDIIVSNASGPISKPTITSIDGFSSYSQGHSQEISIVNGQMTSRSIFSYVLIANSTGRKKIGPFELKIGGKTFTVAAVEVEVVPDSGPSTSPASAWTRGSSATGPVSAPSPRAMPNTNVSNQDIFVKAWLDKDEVYVNEPAILTYTIYTRLSATYKGFEKEPSFTGFWVEDFPPEKDVRRTEQIFNGSRYVVADVRKIAIFPTQAGVFTIDPGVLSAMVEVRDQDDFDSFFSYNIFGRRGGRMPSSFISQVISKAIPTDPATISVKTLPDAGKPVNFSGAVGSYRIDSAIDKSQVEEGDPVTYRIRLNGQGNVNTIELPQAPKLENFKVYDSSSSVNITKDDYRVRGEKVVETVLVPKKAGAYTIPPLQFSYFDPQTKSYKEIRTTAHNLTVTPSAEPQEEAVETPGPLQPVEKQDVWFVGKDIRYIKSAEKISLLPAGLHKNIYYWAFNLLLLLGAGLLSFASSKRDGGPKDLRGLRFRRSHQLAKKKLQNAAVLLKKGDADAFYAWISQALYGYFADKLNISSQNVNYDAVKAGVLPSESATKLLDEIKTLFDELDFGRFARGQKNDESMKKVYELADRVITQFERVKLK